MSRSCDFSTVERPLVIVDSRSGQVLWHGAPLGCPVETVEYIPDSDRAVVLLDYMCGRPTGPYQNLICVDCKGEVVWCAQLPTNTDAYVSFDLRGDELLANSWSGYRVHVDIATGQLLESKFTK